MSWCLRCFFFIFTIVYSWTIKHVRKAWWVMTDRSRNGVMCWKFVASTAWIMVYRLIKKLRMLVIMTRRLADHHFFDNYCPGPPLPARLRRRRISVHFYCHISWSLLLYNTSASVSASSRVRAGAIPVIDCARRVGLRLCLRKFYRIGTYISLLIKSQEVS